jgi:ABC-type phosphate transport system ATPase subunit
MSDTIRGDRTPDPSMADQQDTQSSDPGDAPEVTTAKPAARLAELASGHESNPTEGRETVFQLDKVTISYSGKPAICDVDLSVHRNLVTAFIGPSGCGKTTLLRSLNRMNDLIPGASVDGRISYHGHDLYGSNVDPVELRRRIGMVFQRPNPFPKSIYDNVAYGMRLHLVESLKAEYTIIIVTHNMQQSARVADITAFFSVDVRDDGTRSGVLVEHGPTSDLFIRPSDPRTEAYVTGRFG